MKTKILKLLLCAIIALGSQSCATLFTGSRQDVTFKGIPGTDIYDNNKKIAEVGKNGFVTTPIRKKLSSKKLTAKNDGYQPRTVEVKTKFNLISCLNLTSPLAWGIDAATGKMMKYKDDVVDVTLTPLIFNNYNKSEQADETTLQTVNRDSPGVTDMEKSIVRWYFDSDPRGARIYYRVISNIPDQVKNTNETYLTTTPLEETRSFNILGLSYENSRDVTIEIKVTKRGYEDQIKRYNVRQALDQQEISGFFELVPKSE